MFKKYLPSKKFIIVLSSLVVALILIFSFQAATDYLKNKSAVPNNKNLALQTSFKEFMAIDTDKDGLPDWEEALWKTDPKNPDTDGDGTSDGEEVKAGRDPLKANTAKAGQEPNDKIDPQKIAAEKKTVQEYIDLSATDKLARSLFSQYIATKKVGQTMTESDKQYIVQNFIDNLPNLTYKEYTLGDLTVLGTNTTAEVKNYANQVAEILYNNYQTKTDDVYTIMSTYFSSEDAAAPTAPLQKIQPIIDKNLKTIASLLKVSVPNEAKNGHLLLVNSFYKITQNLLILRDASKDIMLTLSSLENYDANVTNLSSILDNLANYIQSKKISFAATDFGYKLFYDIINGNN